MADLSTSFNPEDVALSSDAASDAQSRVAIVSDAASNAQSKITARSAVWDKRTVVLKIIDESAALTTGDAKMHFVVPDTLSGMNLVSCGAHVYTAPTSGVVSVDLRKITSDASGVDMLSTALTIDETEKDTSTAATPAGIDGATDDVATADPIAVDVTAAASGASGLDVRLTFEKP